MGDAVDAASGLSPRAWLALLVFRERERVMTTAGNVNVYAKAHSGKERSFTQRQLSEALRELEEKGAVVRDGTLWRLA